MTTLISLADGIRGLQKELKSRRFELHFVALGKKAGVRAALADACIGPAATADEKPLKKIKPENKKGKGNEKEEEKKEREREKYTTLVFLYLLQGEEVGRWNELPVCSAPGGLALYSGALFFIIFLLLLLLLLFC